MGLEIQGSQPTGFIGKIIGRLMNKMHTTLYVDYFSNNLPSENSKILDIGCGGGKLLKYLSDKNDSYLLYGLDHSKEMIDLSKQINKKTIDQNRLKLIQGSATEIPLDDSLFDLVTAFETVQFWPDINKSFAEVLRVLRKDGRFLILNRYPQGESKWWRVAKIKSSDDFKAQFKNAGFKDVVVDLDFKKGWIIVNGTKK